MKRLRKRIIAAITISAAALLFAVVLTAGAQTTNVAGNWKLTLETPNGAANPSLVLKQDGEKLTGTYKGRFGESPLEGAIKGKEIKFTVKVNAQGQEIQLEYAGTVDGDSMKGKVKFGDMGEADFSGKKE
ncbi:MAG TPA: hypothetical protein VFV58_35100 [Blastocatellia bacterium]|jgi:hypothetical protein|nr:hypothetical protein [Blastocatellia bacterium]